MPGMTIQGCTDPLADNYDAFATQDDGSCTYTILGCTDLSAYNYDPTATQDDGSCVYSPPCLFTQLGSDIYGEAENDYSGDPISLSSDGLTLAIGATYNDGNGDNSGHVRIYSWDGNSWNQLELTSMARLHMMG